MKSSRYTNQSYEPDSGKTEGKRIKYMKIKTFFSIEFSLVDGKIDFSRCCKWVAFPPFSQNTLLFDSKHSRGYNFRTARNTISGMELCEEKKLWENSFVTGRNLRDRIKMKISIYICELHC